MGLYQGGPTHWPLSLDSFSECLGPSAGCTMRRGQGVPMRAVLRYEASLAHVGTQPVCPCQVILHPPRPPLLPALSPLSSPGPLPPSDPLPEAFPVPPLLSAGLCGWPVPPPRLCPHGVVVFNSLPLLLLRYFHLLIHFIFLISVQRGGPPPGSPPRFPGRACFVFPLNPTLRSLPLPVERGTPSLTPRSWVPW